MRALPHWIHGYCRKADLDRAREVPRGYELDADTLKGVELQLM
jgi:hypothetical protein